MFLLSFSPLSDCVMVIFSLFELLLGHNSSCCCHGSPQKSQDVLFSCFSFVLSSTCSHACPKIRLELWLVSLTGHFELNLICCASVNIEQWKPVIAFAINSCTVNWLDAFLVKWQTLSGPQLCDIVALAYSLPCQSCWEGIFHPDSYPACLSSTIVRSYWRCSGNHQMVTEGVVMSLSHFSWTGAVSFQEAMFFLVVAVLVCSISSSFVFFSAACVRPTIATFDTGTNGFTQSVFDNFDWVRQRGSTSSFNTGPSIDVCEFRCLLWLCTSLFGFSC